MMHFGKRRSILLILLPLALLAALLVAGRGAALAQGDQGLSMTVEAGFDGYFELEQWLPLYVTVSNEGQPVEGWLRVAAGQGPGEDVVYQAAVSLPTQSHKRVPLYVYLPGISGDLTVSLVDGAGNVVAEAESGDLDRVASNELLYGVVSSDPAVWTFLEQVSAGRTDAAAALLDVNDLPANGAAWNGLDVLVFHEIDSGELSSEQQDALRDWLGQGGQLVVTGGPGWQATVAGLDELLPVAVTGTASVSDLPALRRMAGEPFRDEGPYLVTTSELRSGQLLLYDEDLPLLAKRSWGRGAVYFLALDPALPPLLDWRGSEALWTEIASAAPRQPFWAQGPRNGYSAASAVSRLPSLALPSAGLLFLFLLFYVAVVGPGNYLVLKRLGRRELAWFTIPATILVFAILAYVTGFRLRGSEVIFNQMSVAFGHVDGGQMRVNSLLGIYSPRRATYDVSLPESILAHPFDRNYGSLYGTGNQAAISYGGDTRLEDLRVDVSGVETYIASSYQPPPPITGRAVLRLEGQTAQMEVTVQNNGDAPLQNAGVFYGRSFEPLGTLDAGASNSESWSISSGQAAAVAGATTGGAPPVYVSAPGFNVHYEHLLGTPNFYNDPDVQPRLQLLESMHGYSGPTPNAGFVVPHGAVTLVGWMEQPLFEPALVNDGLPVSHSATTLYFLELPVENVIASGEGVTVPPALMAPTVMGDSGIYAPDASQFHLPPGWIEIEYEPWPAFREMDVTSLELSLRAASSSSGTSGLEMRIWNWDEETWGNIPQVTSGRINISNFAPFIGEQNRVRLRLENNSSDGVEISELYPVLTGDLEG